MMEASQLPAMVADEASGIEKESYDSGTSHHMSPFHEHFVMYCEIPACPITAANTCIFYTVGIGDLQIEVLNSVILTKVLLCDALHMPEIGLTVVSIGCIIKAGYTMQFEDRLCEIKKGGFQQYSH